MTGSLMNQFLGRNIEYNTLVNLKNEKNASLVICMGRRRIGKSRLVLEAGKTYKYFLEFQGLAPAKGLTNQDQINYFIKQFTDQTDFPVGRIDNWDSALRLVAKYAEDKEIMIFLDELSWMAAYDRKFPSLLKVVWDTEFSKNSGLVLVLCGSVTTWIQKNILNNTNFIGRITVHLNLKELSILDSAKFWGNKKNTPHEIFNFLCITGGIPKYLEFVNPKISTTNLMGKLLLSKSGFLFNEFDRIFLDVFQKGARQHLDVLKALAVGPKTFSEICKSLKIQPNGRVSERLDNLVTAGFIRETTDWMVSSKSVKSPPSAKSSHFYLSDNYSRFYIKNIIPLRKKIEEGLLSNPSLEELPNFESTMGYAFENLLRNNFSLILESLQINPNNVANWGPYFQRKTVRQKACQIDLLIQTKKTLYVCEFKLKKNITTHDLSALLAKTEFLKYDKKLYSLKKGFLYLGQINSNIKDSEDCDFLIDVATWLKL
jgi:AAA+ ATPase superfamily predicted ATPase